MIRFFAAASASALVLAACAPAAPTPEAGSGASAEIASAAPAAPAAPEGFQTSYLVENETFTVASEIDPAILAFDPALAYRLWTGNKAALDGLTTQAEEDKAYAASDKEAMPFMGYYLRITQAASLVLDDVISVEDTTETYTGGAHPNYFLGGEIYREGVAEPLTLDDIVTDREAFNTQVIKALVAAKIANGYDGSPADIEASLREMLVPSTEYPDIYAGRLSLAPSTEAGKAGAMTVQFSPYDVGAYAEGPYTVYLSAADLAPILKPDWSGRFGGQRAETPANP